MISLQKEKRFNTSRCAKPLTREVCGRVHGNTRTWLHDRHFPYPDQVRFFWDAGHKLTEALEAREDQIILIDDRPEGLISGVSEHC